MLVHRLTTTLPEIELVFKVTTKSHIYYYIIIVII